MTPFLSTVWWLVMRRPTEIGTAVTHYIQTQSAILVKRNNCRNLHSRPALIHLFYLFNLFVKQMALDILRHSRLDLWLTLATGSLMIILLHVCYPVWWSNDYENQSTFGEVIGNSSVSCFFLIHGVCKWSYDEKTLPAYLSKKWDSHDSYSESFLFYAVMHSYNIINTNSCSLNHK